ncbi:MAG: hypothetical protein C0623_06465 [Desulfuromonas sp.]|nr:MAG: hypothetical protein C0623_06465 [Desulfuromonas sp.]
MGRLLVGDTTRISGKCPPEDRNRKNRAVAVGLRFSDRAGGCDLKSNGGKSKAFVPDFLWQLTA